MAEPINHQVAHATAQRLAKQKADPALSNLGRAYISMLHAQRLRAKERVLFLKEKNGRGGC